MKKVLILGARGQDGSYLSEILADKGYEVHGLIRRCATANDSNLDAVRNRIQLHHGDLTDSVSLFRVIAAVQPDEIYNEADQDHAGISYEIPAYNYEVTGAAVGRLLEIIRQINPKIRFFQPLTSNMFGKTDTSPQNESTPFNPQNPYACAKVFAYHLCKMYRQVYGMHISTATFYNHESVRRTPEYLTRKVTQSVARIKAGKQTELTLGDLGGRIDWGYSKEYMEAAWNILQLDEPTDFVIGTGETCTVQDFVNETFALAKLDPARYVKTSAQFQRPASNSILVADTTKAQKAFGFKPQVKYKELIRMMLAHDLKAEGIEL